ncbi:MAG: hypothetical protein MJ093_02970 [Saccharofermentans sp.]|nr:hypothetical protein [Saccharofermentans sp.]
MKKLPALLLISAMTLSMTACNNKSDSKSDETKKKDKKNIEIEFDEDDDDSSETSKATESGVPLMAPPIDQEHFIYAMEYLGFEEVQISSEEDWYNCNYETQPHGWFAVINDASISNPIVSFKYKVDMGAPTTTILGSGPDGNSEAFIFAEYNTPEEAQAFFDAYTVFLCDFLEEGSMSREFTDEEYIVEDGRTTILINTKCDLTTSTSTKSWSVILEGNKVMIVRYNTLAVNIQEKFQMFFDYYQLPIPTDVTVRIRIYNE